MNGQESVDGIARVTMGMDVRRVLFLDAEKVEEGRVPLIVNNEAVSVRVAEEVQEAFEAWLIRPEIQSSFAAMLAEHGLSPTDLRMPELMQLVYADLMPREGVIR